MAGPPCGDSNACHVHVRLGTLCFRAPALQGRRDCKRGNHHDRSSEGAVPRGPEKKRDELVHDIHAYAVRLAIMKLTVIDCRESRLTPNWLYQVRPSNFMSRWSGGRLLTGVRMNRYSKDSVNAILS